MTNFTERNIVDVSLKDRLLTVLPDNLVNYIQFHDDLNLLDFSDFTNYYLYTGRGPSNSSFHIGHLMGLNLTLELQKILKNKIYFMISDDEKIFRDNNYDEIYKNTKNTIEQLNKIGFNDTNTEFCINSFGISENEYKILINLMSNIKISTFKSIFGAKKTIGEYFYPLRQIAYCFKQKKQCIVICGIEQRPFFSLARDLAKKNNCPKPIIIYTKTIIGLDGSPKMTTTFENSIPIFLNDDPSVIISKINKIKKVGAGSIEELFENGCDLSIDIPFQLIQSFDNNLSNINLLKKAYTIGLFDDLDVINLSKLIDNKFIVSKNNKTMITTSGIRNYLSVLIINLLSIFKS